MTFLPVTLHPMTFYPMTYNPLKHHRRIPKPMTFYSMILGRFSFSYQCNKRIWIRIQDFRVTKCFNLAERPTVLFPRKNFSTHILDFSLEVTLIPKHLILLWIEFFSSFNIFLEIFFNSKTVFCHPNTMNEWRSVGDKVWRTPFSFSPMNVWKWEILVVHKYSSWKSPCNSGFEVLST